MNEKVTYLQANIGADIFRDGEKSYRAAARLTDGTYLPCVQFSSPNPRIDYVHDRLKASLLGKTIDENLPLSDILVPIEIAMYGNQVKHWELACIEPSPYAFPPEIYQKINGETTMGWTGFAARMRDGKHFGFGSTLGFEFFEMPEGYAPSDVVEIINHAYVLKSGELRHHQRAFMQRPSDYDDAVVHLSRPFFDCFIEGL